MFAMFDENPAMTLQDFKETKRYGQRENSIPTTKFARGIIIALSYILLAS